TNRAARSAYRWRTPGRVPGGTPAPDCVRPASSVGFVGFQERERRPRHDVGIEHQRPVLDVVEVMLDAALDRLRVLDLAAPAVDLRPAGDAGLDPVAGEVAVDRVVETAVLDLLIDGMRARPDQRQVALEHDVEELRQLVDRGLADEA